jgi:hypothetical protein
MLRKFLPVLILAGFAVACDGARTDDDAAIDTTMHVLPDTVLIEETITRDTIRDPDLGRDTLNRDTIRDTIPR